MNTLPEVMLQILPGLDVATSEPLPRRAECATRAKLPGVLASLRTQVDREELVVHESIDAARPERDGLRTILVCERVTLPNIGLGQHRLLPHGTEVNVVAVQGVQNNAVTALELQSLLDHSCRHQPLTIRELDELFRRRHDPHLLLACQSMWAAGARRLARGAHLLHTASH